MEYIANPELLKLKFKNGHLMLPWFYTTLMYKKNSQQFSGSGNKPVSFAKRLFNLIKQVKNFKVKKRSILIFSSCLFNVKNEKGEYFNSLHGFYYDLFPNDSLLIEDGDLNNEWRPTGNYESVSYINTLFTFITSILSVLCNKVKRRYNSDYDVLLELFLKQLSRKEISIADYSISIYSRLIRWLIRRVQPKIIFVNCGSYGVRQGIICKIAREYNIKTIDTQHGQVYNHAAYCASPVIYSSREYMEYMPDFLYTFGDYWSNLVEWNYKKISVGNPYLNKYFNQYATISEYEKDILIISQPIFKELQIPFVKKLAELCGDRKIFIRLHPAERIESQRELYKNYSNIYFSDSTVVLYRDMCSSKFVVGWNSTCLFEYVGFGRIPFIIDNEISRGHFPENIGVWVKTPEELCKKINSGNSLKTDNAEYYWKQNFEENVKNHIANIM